MRARVKEVKKNAEKLVRSRQRIFFRAELERKEMELP